MADTLVHSATKLKETWLDFGYMAIVQWIDGMKHIAEYSQINVIFMYASSDSL